MSVPSKPKFTLKIKVVPDEVIKHLEKFLQPQSVPNYLRTIILLNENVFHKMIFNLENYDKYFDEIIAYIRTTGTSAISRLNHVRKVLSFYYTDTDQLMLKYDKVKNELKSGKGFTKAKKDLGIKYDDIVAKWQSLKTLVASYIASGNPLTKTEKLKQKQFVMLSFYALMPPIRSSEILTAKLVELPENQTIDQIRAYNTKSNFIDMTSGIMVVNKAKSKTKWFSLKNPMENKPIELFDIIKDYWLANGKRFYLMETLKQATAEIEPTNESDFCIWFKKIYIKGTVGLSCNDYRNIYISDEIFDKNMIAKDRERVSYLMGHDLSQQYLTYSKYSQSLHQEDDEC